MLSLRSKKGGIKPVRLDLKCKMHIPAAAAFLVFFSEKEIR